MRSLGLAGLLVLAGTAAQAATLVIRAEGVTPDGNRIYAGICDRSFEEATCPYRASSPASAGRVELRVRNVKPGSYAIAVFHDRNGNAKLDRSFIGLPASPTASRTTQAGAGAPISRRPASSCGSPRQPWSFPFARGAMQDHASAPPSHSRVDPAPMGAGFSCGAPAAPINDPCLALKWAMPFLEPEVRSMPPFSGTDRTSGHGRTNAFLGGHS
ncbi:DUF2141 domain-containing protein [Microvirga lenta]|uniref:DUF2141 domain-containing protein n=1 Tax=Microvirga lenta TaxID=2881337 RepID=UPI001CFDC38A|nr:DUF2141 domain-containing protein [Microvirga lenta]MCB5174415.1 DUF2141 domain-containing protein [Microvirga lenta]